MSSSLLFQQCPACLVRLIWIVFVMGGRWPYSCCFVRCCFQDLLVNHDKHGNLLITPDIWGILILQSPKYLDRMLSLYNLSDYLLYMK